MIKSNIFIRWACCFAQTEHNLVQREYLGYICHNNCRLCINFYSKDISLRNSPNLQRQEVF
jgi:hypothetical protein